MADSEAYEDPFAPADIDGIPPLPRGAGIDLIYRCLSFAVAGATDLTGLAMALQGSRAAIAMLRKDRPDLFAQLQAQVQPLRHTLLQDAIAGAVDRAALEKIAALHKPSFEALGKSRPDLVAQLRGAYRVKLASFAGAAAA